MEKLQSFSYGRDGQYAIYWRKYLEIISKGFLADGAKVI
jgi:hypothetical protein